MTALLCQVTCALCNIKIDETKRKEQLLSKTHLRFCKNNKDKTAKKFFEMIFDYCLKKKKILILKKQKKKHAFWQSQFATKLSNKNLIFYAMIQSKIEK